MFVHFKGDRFQYYMMLLNIDRILIVQERRNQLRAELIQQEIASTRIRQRSLIVEREKFPIEL